MGAFCTSAVSAKAAPPPWWKEAASTAHDHPPGEPDEALSVAYKCEVLRTSSGLVRGCWATFEPQVFWRPIPGSDPVRLLRHTLVVALGLVSSAEREGEQVDAVELGEGSFARVFGAGQVVARVISDRERDWVHRDAVKGAREADCLGLGPRCYGHGRLLQTRGGTFEGTVIFQERLDPLGESWSPWDTAALLHDVARLARNAFHNDLKLPNILRRNGRPTLIDFDMMSPWIIKVAVTSSCIERNLQELLDTAGETATWNFREYYDLFALTLSLEDGPLYRACLERLQRLWAELETLVLRPLLDSRRAEDEIRQVPFEMIVRVPLEGVSVNLLDLRGNLYAHIAGDSQGQGRQKALDSCMGMPQLLDSHGVYWPS
eukprot:TRINITY_DN71472_c0_g1_i1.p1 TRINITY_DN71472_c0_g1~~TRINITY_DN71472_c0_g1_i1.p1  ORF type:complete len:375 (+),score=63.57 TRINITY_DN71472_c0_g1_i1:97-1221(+)